MEYIIEKKTYPAPEIDIKEIMRYSGIGKLTQELEKLIFECLDEILGKLTYSVCYLKTPFSIDGPVVDFGFAKAESVHLSKALSGYGEAIIFAASIGIEIDRIIKKYSNILPSKSVIFQAIGAERTESLCNCFCGEIEDKYRLTGPRFSPGYGDFSLEFQRDIFRVLDPKKYIGVNLGENLIMSPSKSVTAIIGING